MIRITVWIQGLLSEFVTIGRYGKWLTLILIRQMAALVRRALAEVSTVPVLLVTLNYIELMFVHWPLVGGLLHLVHGGGAWAECPPSWPVVAVANAIVYLSS